MKIKEIKLSIIRDEASLPPTLMLKISSEDGSAVGSSKSLPESYFDEQLFNYMFDAMKRELKEKLFGENLPRCTMCKSVLAHGLNIGSYYCPYCKENRPG
jgi:hypothetical protein